MKQIEAIKEHLSTTLYTKTARTAIRYWLLGKEVIDADTQLEFRRRTYGKQIADTFEAFLMWYNDADEIQPKAQEVKLDASLFTTSSYKPDEIVVGDYVKVNDMDNPRDEYVEFIAQSGDDRLIGLSDGTWYKDCYITPYAMQGCFRDFLVYQLGKVR